MSLLRTYAVCCSTEEDISGQMKNLFDGLPPIWLTRFGACGPIHQALLITISHFPPLPNLWVPSHFLHVASVVVTDILETSKQNPRCIIPPNRVFPWSVQEVGQ